MTLYNHDLKKSIKIFLNFFINIIGEALESLFGSDNSTSENNNVVFYPTLLGIDGLGYYDSRLAEAAFEELNTYLGVCDFLDVIICDTVNEYVFLIETKPETKDIAKLKSLLWKQSQKILNTHFKNIGFRMPTKPLVWVCFDSEEDPEYLYVYFARNSLGISDISNLKEAERQLSKDRTAPPSHDVFTATWKGEEKDD